MITRKNRRKGKVGFAAIPGSAAEAARIGHRKKALHEWTSEEARVAGSKGGKAKFRKWRERMAARWEAYRTEQEIDRLKEVEQKLQASIERERMKHSGQD